MTSIHAVHFDNVVDFLADVEDSLQGLEHIQLDQLVVCQALDECLESLETILDALEHLSLITVLDLTD